MQKYILVEWPESQMLMEHQRFNECLLVQDIDDINLLNELEIYYIKKFNC